jgi:hypothetical protein
MVDSFFKKMKDVLVGNDEEVSQDEYYNKQVDNREFADIRPASEDPYGDPAENGLGEIRPASEDPYGDPADTGEFADIRPASEDPYGDPADYEASNYGQYGDIRPASEDPYGDPADQYNV